MKPDRAVMAHLDRPVPLVHCESALFLGLQLVAAIGDDVTRSSVANLMHWLVLADEDGIAAARLAAIEFITAAARIAVRIARAA